MVTSVLLCPLCGDTVHRDTHADFRVAETVAAEAEAAVHGHLRDRHAARYWLWRRVKWDRIVKGFFGA